MFVLDASVTAAWVFSDESSAYADVVLERLKRTGAIVPEIWPLEVGNVLLVGERRERLTRSEADRFLELLLTLPIAVSKVVEAGDGRQLVALGRQYAISAYDAAYLQLSLRDGLPLATQDDRLLVAAGRAGVEVLRAGG